MNRIAFFGGSFDPPHRGHLAIAKAAADRFALDEILFAPVAHQPLKSGRWKIGQTVTPFEHRYAMTALATQDDARFVPSLLDAPRGANRQEPNYTVDTLQHLRASLAESNDAVVLLTLLGADSWLDIARWHGATQLLALTDWIVAARPGFSLSDAGHALPPRVTAKPFGESADRGLRLHHYDGATTTVHFLPYLQEDSAATIVREALHAGHIDQETLTPPVWEYIRKAGLYGTK